MKYALTALIFFAVGVVIDGTPLDLWDQFRIAR